MTTFSKLSAAVLMLVTFNAIASEVLVTQNLRAEARYYVRYDQISQQGLDAVGLPFAPGTWDDEGYCKISGLNFNSNGQMKTVELQAGDVLKAVSEATWTRKEYDYASHSVISIQDKETVFKRRSDGAEVALSCSIDASASERAPYKGIENDFTKSYLTILGLIVR